MLALLQTGFATGTHELYQLPLGHAAGRRTPRSSRSPSTSDWAVYDALADPELGRELLRWIDDTGELRGRGTGASRSTSSTGGSTSREDTPVRPMGVEQSNSSLVFGDELMREALPQARAGLNPELEMLRFLTAHGFENIAPLYGWAEYEGDSLSATLAVVQRFFADGTGGWELALDELAQRARTASSSGSPRSARSRRGCTPCSPRTPTDPGVRARGAEPGVAVAADRHRRRGHRADLRPPARRRRTLEPIAGRGQDVQERLAMLAQVGAGGRVIRTHGDYHLGQTLLDRRAAG